MNLDTASNLLVAAGTGALGWFTWRLARGTVDLVEVGTRQAEETERAAKAAEASAAAATEAVREATRARLDARAPHVVTFLEPPQWPPLIDKRRSALPQANELRLLDPNSLRSSPKADGEYVFVREQRHFMWFRCSGLLRNEGKTTARVRLNGEAQFLVEELDEFVVPPERKLVPMDPSKPLYQPEHLLGPDEEVRFEWASGHTLEEWADAYEHPDPPNPKGALFFSITATDPTGRTVDNIFAVVAGRPIEPVPAANSHWQPTSSDQMGLTIYPTVRRYVGENTPPESPPWEETYQ